MNRLSARTWCQIVSLALAVAVLAPVHAAPSTCTAPEYRQFDFWIGNWDTFESDAPDGPSIARARISSIADGCALHELYEQHDGLIGDSILSYDQVRKKWQQTWVTNRGSLMVIVGSFKDDALVLEGDVHTGDGRTVRQRITWERKGDDVREWALHSSDGGKSWTPAFDVVFRKRKNDAD